MVDYIEILFEGLAGLAAIIFIPFHFINNLFREISSKVNNKNTLDTMYMWYIIVIFGIGVLAVSLLPLIIWPPK